VLLARSDGGGVSFPDGRCADELCDSGENMPFIITKGVLGAREDVSSAIVSLAESTSGSAFLAFVLQTRFTVNSAFRSSFVSFGASEDISFATASLAEPASLLATNAFVSRTGLAVDSAFRSSLLTFRSCIRCLAASRDANDLVAVFKGLSVSKLLDCFLGEITGSVLTGSAQC
jgi:hypothetical protein